MFGRDLRGFQPQQRKRAHRGPFYVEGKQIPMVVDAAQVMRMHQAALGLFAAQVPVLAF